MAENAQPKTSRRLNHQQYYKLVQWIAVNGERLMKEKPTYTAAAIQAGEALGYLVPEDRTFKEAMSQAGVTWISANSLRPGYPRISKEEFESMRGRLRQAEADVAVLRKVVHHLYREMDVSPPAGYTLPPQEVSPLMTALRDQSRVSDGAGGR